MIRFLVFLLSAYLLLLLQTTLISHLLPGWLRPDPMIPLVTYLGVVFPMLRGALLVMACGLLLDTFSGAPFGLFMFAYLCLFFFLKSLSRFLILGGSLRFLATLVIASAGLQALLFLLLSAVLSIPGNSPFSGARQVLLPLLATGALGCPLLRIFRHIDPAPGPEAFPVID
ncbi:MAG: hypothetical protein HY697_00330 [Deltaproteobacteria bacterium]|nr:hypothetical protein [Deltaproteobacteria bacterium]